MSAAIRMDGSGKITMDGGSSDGHWQCDGRWNGKTIAIGKAVQWEAMQDGWQRQSRWMAASRLQWTVAAAMGNGGALGGKTAKQS